MVDRLRAEVQRRLLERVRRRRSERGRGMQEQEGTADRGASRERMRLHRGKTPSRGVPLDIGLALPGL